MGISYYLFFIIQYVYESFVNCKLRMTSWLLGQYLSEWTLLTDCLRLFNWTVQPLLVCKQVINSKVLLLRFFANVIYPMVFYYLYFNLRLFVHLRLHSVTCLNPLFTTVLINVLSDCSSFWEWILVRRPNLDEFSASIRGQTDRFLSERQRLGQVWLRFLLNWFVFVSADHSQH